MVAFVLITGVAAVMIEGLVRVRALDLCRSSIVRSVLLDMYVLLQGQLCFPLMRAQ